MDERRATRVCMRCLLPDTMPGLSFNSEGLCSICQETPSLEVLAADRASLRAKLSAVIDAHRGKRPYEVIVAFSGGKDSSFTLKYLAGELGLRCLAVTIDNGFLSGGTYANCKAVCDALGVDHLLFTPNARFAKRMYRVSAQSDDIHAPSAIKRASSICSSCIAMINTFMLQKAMELRVSIVAGGYLGGQVPRDGALMSIRPGQQVRIRTSMVNRLVKVLGEDSRPYFDLATQAADADHEVTVINPMLGVDLSEDAILASLAPLGWVRPKDTGRTSTNCRLNDLGVYIHARRHGFHPYAMEIAEQLRQGTLSIDRAKSKLEDLPQRAEVRWLADQIGLSPNAY
jgi:tRNA(Ile)-lysidine synthase TilS/MesJ